MKSKRIGWTKILGHVLGYHIHQDPASVLIVQPTIEDAEGYSKEEVQPTIEETPVLRERVADAKSRTAGNTMKKKTYPGGMLHLVGANSPTGFRRITVRVVLFDEVDGYPQAAGVEGDQIKLGMGRSETFWNRKHGIGSTPTLKDFSRIERHYNASSRGLPFLQCPHCGEWHVRKFRQPAEPIVLQGEAVAVSYLHWEDGAPDFAAWVCPDCGGLISHRHHRSMINGLRWKGEHWEWADGRFTFLPGFTGKIGFHIWAGYSFSPNATPRHLVREFLEAKDSQELLIVFVNTVLGETWEDPGEKLSEKALVSRAEQPSDCVPMGAEVLTLGADLQADRIEYEITGWNRTEESWSVEYGILYGDPALDDVWTQLENVLTARYVHESGAELAIASACIDSGYMAERVYAFCARVRTPCYPVKGMPGFGRPIVETGRQRIKRLRKRRIQGVKPELIGVDEAKTVIHRRLQLTRPGPGYCHFPNDRDEEYFAQLTSEKLITRYTKGRPERFWVPIRTRNEALDCRVYDYAALLLYGVNNIKPPRSTEEKRSWKNQKQTKSRSIRKRPELLIR